jgi:hypothetical protein
VFFPWSENKYFVCSAYGLKIWVARMELRHLRYFIAVAEEGSLTNAAERLLHTAQPSLSRQIRDLELEIGVKLLERMARGIALTGAAAGRSGLKPLVAPNSPRSQCLQAAFSQDRRSYGCQTRCATRRNFGRARPRCVHELVAVDGRDLA